MALRWLVAVLGAPLFARTPGLSKAPLRDRLACIALAPLVVLVLGVAAWAPWYSHPEVDSFTVFEQVRAVAEHGTVSFENGPAERYWELHPRWLIAARGRTWGIYPAPLAYLLAPGMWLGGYRGVIRLLWLMIGFCGVGTYALVARASGRRGLALVAGYAVVLSSSMGSWATAVTAFVPAATMNLAALLSFTSALAHRGARDDRAVLARIAATGLFASLAVGSHITSVFAWVFLGGVVALTAGGARAALLHLLVYLLASAPSLGLMAWVNHLRFDTFNPLSYGPCGTNSCDGSETQQTFANYVRFAKSLAPFALVLVSALWLARHSAAASGAVCVVWIALAVIPRVPMFEPFLRVTFTLWHYVVDVGLADIGLPRASENIGALNHDVCVRSLLECSPLFAAAIHGAGAMRPLARRHLSSHDAQRNEDPTAPERDERGVEHATGRALVLGAAAIVLGVLAGVAPRATETGAYVFGVPVLNMRYLVAAIPAATALALYVLRDVRARVWHVPVALAATLWLGAWVLERNEVTSLERRVVTHLLPLLLAVALVALVASARGDRARRGDAAASAGDETWPLARRVAARLSPLVRAARDTALALVVFACVGYGAVVALAIDRPALLRMRENNDARVRELARCTPERFVLLGGIALDESLALRDRRAITFINVGMGPRDGSGARTLIEQFGTQRGPAFLLQDTDDGPWHFEWPGYRFAPLPGCPRVWSITRTATP